MRTMRWVSIIAISVMTITANSAGAQTLQDMVQQNIQFDNAMNQRLMQLQQQNAAYGQQIWQSYLEQFGPQLREEYQKYVAAGNPPVTFEQFAYWNLVTAHGTDIAGAMREQQQQFDGMQRAHQTQMQGFDDYNAAMQRNSQATETAVDNYTRQAVQGNAPYIDPGSGATLWLPSSLPAGQVYSYGGNSYAQDPTGTYYQWQGNAWVRMNAAPH